MHYVVFLMSRGATPYKQIIDVNLPGSYLMEAAAMKVFGWGALGWRLYDLTLLLLLTASAIVVCGRKHWYAGLFAGALFSAIHLQDGLTQAGQRDLVIAVLVMFAYAVLFVGHRRGHDDAALFLVALTIGLTVVIKPVFVLLGIAVLVASVMSARANRTIATRRFYLSFAGLIAPVVAVCGWLALHGALQDFFWTVRFLVPYHAQLGRKPFAYLLTHALSPVMPLCAFCLALMFVRRRRISSPKFFLLIGCAAALAAYVLQGKGYPYQRYPALSLLLLLTGMEISKAMSAQGFAKWITTIALTYACCIVGPLAVWRVQSFRPDEPFRQALTASLASLGVPLQGQVQCLDTFGGCINTLYDLRLVQSTGFLYDCYLFTPGHDPVAEQYRQRFWNVFQQARPRVLVITNQYCFASANPRKLDRWPLLRGEIASKYSLAAEWQPIQPQRWWSRPELPWAFSIYVRHQE